MKNNTGRAALMKGGKTLDQILEAELKKPSFKKAYEHHLLEAAVAEQLIAHRQKRHLTQQQVADRAGMKQAAVARIEAGKQNLSLATIQLLAHAVGCQVAVTIKPA